MIYKVGSYFNAPIPAPLLWFRLLNMCLNVVWLNVFLNRPLLKLCKNPVRGFQLLTTKSKVSSHNLLILFKKILGMTTNNDYAIDQNFSHITSAISAGILNLIK